MNKHLITLLATSMVVMSAPAFTNPLKTFFKNREAKRRQKVRDHRAEQAANRFRSRQAGSGSNKSSLKPILKTTATYGTVVGALGSCTYFGVKKYHATLEDAYNATTKYVASKLPSKAQLKNGLMLASKYTGLTFTAKQMKAHPVYTGIGIAGLGLGVATVKKGYVGNPLNGLKSIKTRLFSKKAKSSDKTPELNASAPVVITPVKAEYTEKTSEKKNFVRKAIDGLKAKFAKKTKSEDKTVDASTKAVVNNVKQNEKTSEKKSLRTRLSGLNKHLRTHKGKYIAGVTATAATAAGIVYAVKTGNLNRNGFKKLVKKPATLFKSFTGRKAKKADRKATQAAINVLNGLSQYSKIANFQDKRDAKLVNQVMNAIKPTITNVTNTVAKNNKTIKLILKNQ